MDQIHQFAPKNAKVVLVGNKADMEVQRVISTEEGRLIRPGGCVGIQDPVFRDECLQWPECESGVRESREDDHR